MTAWFARPLTTLAFCWRLERRDGVTIGFTSHDRPLEVDGIVYRAAPGMVPSAISLSDGLDADTLDVSGALTDAAIRDADLAGGRWDGAQVTLFACDWEEPAATVLPITSGVLGGVTVKDRAFTSELRGPAARLEEPAVPQTSPECRAELGDRRCRVPLAPRTRFCRVVAATEDGEITLNGAEPTPGCYAYGRLRWIDGPLSGMAMAVAWSDADRVRLRESIAPLPAAGTLVELREGCDKRFETCCARFGNAANFRGEPHLPGNDLLTRYPGS